MNTLDRLVAMMKEVLDEEVDPAKVKPEASLTEDLGLKSIGMLYMAMAIEQEFGVRFENSDLTSLKTVQDILDRVEKK